MARFSLGRLADAAFGRRQGPLEEPVRPLNEDPTRTLEDLQERLSGRIDDLEELMALSGDPEALEGSDLDASEDYDIVQTEQGTLVLSGPNGSVETRRVLDEEVESFADLEEILPDLIEEKQASAGAVRESIEAAKALTGDPEQLEASDLDASEDFSLTQTADGTLMITGPLGTFETRMAFDEEVGSFEDLSALRIAPEDRREARQEAIEAAKGLTGEADALEATDLDASEDFDLSQTEDGTLLISGPSRMIETRRSFEEDIDSFEELGALEFTFFELFKERVDNFEPPTAEAIEDLAVMQGRFASLRENSDVEDALF